MSILEKVAAVRIRPDQLEAYLQLHRNQPHDVRSAMIEANVLSYKMYLLQSQSMVISVARYAGETRGQDAARMAANPSMQDWWAQCRPMQSPLPEAAGQGSGSGSLWAPLPQVYTLV